FLGNNSRDEKELLHKAEKSSSEDKELILKEIFLKSRDYGLGLKTINKATLTLDDITGIIKILKVPCFMGNWSVEPSLHYYTLERTVCPLKEKSSFICEYWQEAMDGLIMGLGESERFSRHRSLVKGENQNCLDVIYDSDYIDLRWGDIPDQLKKSCQPLINHLDRKSTRLNS